MTAQGVTQAQFRILLFMKRRPGMSVAAFRDYYETQHAPLCLKYAGPGLKRYVRRYLDPQRNPETGEAGELAFDVITELWFEDEAAWSATVKHLTTRVMPPEIVADEERLFDRARTRMATVVECEKGLGGADAV